MQILLNKSDKLSKSKASQALMKCKSQTSQNLLLGEPMLLSAKTTLGVEELSEIILNLLQIFIQN
jgi:GTP-binding protein EngB required for normal cell division